MQKTSNNILPGKSLLLVNFDQQKMHTTLEQLKTYQFNSNFADSTAQGDNFLAAKQYDLIICYWQENDNSFIAEFISHIRNNDKTFKLPIVIISSVIDPTAINQLIKLGISEYLVLPFTQVLLEERLMNAIDLPIRNHSQQFSGQLLTKRHKNITKLAEIQILVVDDAPINIEMVAGVLKGKYRVRAANNARSAMKLCQSDSPPDIILLDIMMPDIDGLTFFKQLKANPLTQDIRVIFTTALSGVEDIVKGLELGAVDYITKPIIPQILLARVKTHCQLILQHHAMQRQIDNLISKYK